MASASPPSTAVILAAGAGRRLRGTHEGPKGLLQISDEKLVPRSMRLLAEFAGVAKFVVAVGWRAEAYRNELKDWGAAVCFVENPDFADTGSLRSFALAAAETAGDIWLLESDILYEVRALEALTASGARDAILASGPTGAGDEVWVFADDAGGLEMLGKKPLPGRAAVGELVGISRLSEALASSLAAAAGGFGAQANYEDGLNALCRAHPVSIVSAGDLVWSEIDDASQLDRARRDIWPRIRSKESACA